jgi:tetratricopeptide (TPR) repeat protein
MRLAWPTASWRTAIWIGVVVALVALVGIGLWLWLSIQQQRMREAYAEVTTMLQAGRTAEARPEVRAAIPGVLERFLARYPSSSRAPEAAYELGNVRADAGQWAQARGAYQIALAQGARGTIHTLAQAGIGSTWEAERNFGKAAEAYQAALTGIKPTDFYYEQLCLDLGRVQEAAGHRPEAIETYRRLLKQRPGSARAAEVRSRLAALGAS